MEELIFKRGIPISSHQKIRRICVQKGVVLAVPAIQCSVRHVSPEISNQLTENTSTMSYNKSLRRQIYAVVTDCYTIKCDGMRYQSNMENLSIAIRYVRGDSSLKISQRRGATQSSSCQLHL